MACSSCGGGKALKDMFWKQGLPVEVKAVKKGLEAKDITQPCPECGTKYQVRPLGLSGKDALKWVNKAHKP